MTDSTKPTAAAAVGSLLDRGVRPLDPTGYELPAVLRDMARYLTQYSQARKRRHLLHAAAEIERLQTRIDALMLEHCPDEMTHEQMAEWARHQVAAPDFDEAALDAALKA